MGQLEQNSAFQIFLGLFDMSLATVSVPVTVFPALVLGKSGWVTTFTYSVKGHQVLGFGGILNVKAADVWKQGDLCCEPQG